MQFLPDVIWGIKKYQNYFHWSSVAGYMIDGLNISRRDSDLTSLVSPLSRFFSKKATLSSSTLIVVDGCSLVRSLLYIFYIEYNIRRLPSLWISLIIMDQSTTHKLFVVGNIHGTFDEELIKPYECFMVESGLFTYCGSLDGAKSILHHWDDRLLEDKYQEWNQNDIRYPITNN